MLPDSVNSLYRDLRDTILRFKSPAFGRYFLKKAEDDFNDVRLRAGSKEDSNAVKRYLAEQGELLDVLRRQTVIYNMFYDKTSGI